MRFRRVNSPEAPCRAVELDGVAVYHRLCTARERRKKHKTKRKRDGVPAQRGAYRGNYLAAPEQTRVATRISAMSEWTMVKLCVPGTIADGALMKVL
jgi:hypothetical protein